VTFMQFGSSIFTPDGPADFAADGVCWSVAGGKVKYLLLSTGTGSLASTQVPSSLISNVRPSEVTAATGSHASGVAKAQSASIPYTRLITLTHASTLLCGAP
jgi:hypothetical protein